jgi:hypothetical protein
MAESPGLLSRPLLLASLALLVLSLKRGVLRKLRILFLVLVTIQAGALLVAVAKAPTLLGLGGLVLLSVAAILAWRDLVRSL